MTVISHPNSLTDAAAHPADRRDRNLLIVLVLATLALYLRTRSFDFINYDDQLYVFGNPYVPQGLCWASLHWAMTTAPNGNWHPLTILVHILTSSVFGVHAGAFHLVNVSLHMLNVALLYAFFRQATGRIWPAFFTALLWGLHPVRVESVAWISELKDVLSGAFWLGCMLAYLRYSRRRTLAGLGIVVLLQALALLSKPMAITLPAVLLLLDYWPLRFTTSSVDPQHADFQHPLKQSNTKALDYWGKVVSPTDPRQWWMFRLLEKLPLILLTIIDIRLQQNPLLFNSDALTFGMRVQNAMVSCVLYLRDIVFPHHLAVFYPHPNLLGPHGQPISIAATVLSGTLLLAITAVVCLRRKHQPYLVVGWFWFVGTLVPVMGLVQVGEQARADRFTYMPSMGIIFAVVWWIADLTVRKASLQRMAAAGGVLAAVALAITAEIDIGYWKNTSTLFGHLREIQPDNYLAITFACTELCEAGQLDAALAAGRQAIAIAPMSYYAHSDYAASLRAASKRAQTAGNMKESAEELQQAADEFYLATRISPRISGAHDELGRVRDEQAGQCELNHDATGARDFRERAVNDFSLALVTDPDSIGAREHLAFQFAMLNRMDDAIKNWEDALKIVPTFAQAHGDMAEALRIRGDIPDAVEHYQAAIAAGAKNPDWETNLAWIVATSPANTPADVEPVIAIAKDACDQSSNQNPKALHTYAACLARVGRFDDAVTAAKQALALAKDPVMTRQIAFQLSRYEKAQTYVFGDDPADKPAGKAPSTTQSAATRPD